MQSVKPWLAEAARRPGARLIWASTAGLAVLALATFYVSFRAQFTFMYAVKHQDLPALIEALIADVAMVVCSLLALGMACAGAAGEGGPPAGGRLRGPVRRDELPGGRRVLVPLGGGVRDAPGGVRGVHRPDGGGDPPARPGHRRRFSLDGAGPAGARRGRLAGIILLYSLRFILAPAETAKGLRRVVLNAAPLPEAGQDHPAPEAVPEAAPEVLPR